VGSILAGAGWTHDRPLTCAEAQETPNHCAVVTRLADGGMAFDEQDCTSRTTISAASIPALRVTPAMEAGITDHVWTISELLS
jgi:hypothetical protein